MIDPRGLTLQDWCDSVALGLANFAPPPRLMDAALWREWANTVIQIPAVALFSPPDPQQFTHWYDWAERFVQAVPT